jgi:oligosaccharide repeat unit polymerase
MLRINKLNLVGLGFLFLSVIIYFYSLATSGDSIILYTLLLACLTIAILLNNNFELISPAILFTAYYIYSVAVGSILLMIMGRFYSYGYIKIILGGLLAFACGNEVFILGDKRCINEKEDRSKIRLNFSRVNALYILLVISWAAAVYYLIRNIVYLTSNIEDGRVSALSGNGAILYIAQLSILLVCMLFDLFIETGKNGKPIISKYKMFFVTAVSTINLSVSGYRAPVVTLFICMIIMYAGKKKISMWRIFSYGLLCIIAVSFLGAIRTVLSGGISSTLSNLITSLYVSNINLKSVYDTFPDRVNFQYGYTYLINFLMLRPGPDLDFTLWLKEQVGVSYSGGGLTPTILGEFYINFGEPAIFTGMFLMGAFSVYLNRYFKQHKGSFLAVFYVWQFAHCVSGGIANVIVTVLLYTIVYKCLIMLPYGTMRRQVDGKE